MAGAKLEANYPISVITDGMGLNITVMSYLGRLDFGIVADREQMPDLWSLIGWLGDALAELKPVGGRSKPRQRAAAGNEKRRAGNGKPAPAKAKSKAGAKQGSERDA
jgi:hypothetical protein